MTQHHHVFLIPGFFGFTSLGQLHYFVGVEKVLRQTIEEAGDSASTTVIETRPTASIRQRAARILETITSKAKDTDGPIHLIGHSTGGVDARLIASPSNALVNGHDASKSVGAELLVERLTSVVTLSTPHHGTPLAAFFSTLLGKQLLKLVAVMVVYSLRYGHLPLSLILKVTAAIKRFDDVLGMPRNLLDELYDQVLAGFSDQQRRGLMAFMNDIAADRSLLLQLTPEGMDILNAATTDRNQVRYGSVISRSRPPSLRGITRNGLDPYAHMVYAIYTVLYKATTRVPRHISPLLPAHDEALRQGFEKPPRKRDNDGIVPTRSQPWGEIIACVEADHLDVIGHFDGRDQNAAHIDWMGTGTGFTYDAFVNMWRAIAHFIMGS